MNGASLNALARTVFVGRLTRIAIFAVLSLSLTATAVYGQYCTPDQCDECNLRSCSQRCCHELPELWLVNTRCAPRCKNLDSGFDRLIYKRYDRKCCRWIRESRESFLAQESTMPTLFYAHGNSLNHKNAMKGFWQVYCKMRCCPGPKRLVCWSWPAERVFKTERLRVREMIEKNLRIKYVYAEYQGYYMAKLVDQMSLSQRVMMSGHSYGGIITSSAAHYLGAGCLRGLTLAGSAAVERPQLRVAVISGAYDYDMLNPGNRYGQAFVAAEKIFVTRNIKDSTLKKWPKTSWCGKRAIGVIGVNANRLGVYRDKLCQQTMTVDVGKSHYLKPHLKSVRFVAALCCLSFPQCNTCSPLAASEQPAQPELAPALGDLNETGQALEEKAVLGGDQFVADDIEFKDSTFQHSAFDDSALEKRAEDGNARFTNSDLFTNEKVNLADLEPATAQQYDASVLQPEPMMYVVATNDNPLELPQVHTQSSAPNATLAYDELELGSYSTEISTKSKETPVLEQQPAIEVAATDPQITEPAKVSSKRVWYRCGFCLALVLTGQFYILFSKRVTPS